MDLLVDVYSENMCAEMVEAALNYWKIILRISTQTYLEFYRFRPSIIRNELMGTNSNQSILTLEITSFLSDIIS
jgi:hypothetical protein